MFGENASSSLMPRTLEKQRHQGKSYHTLESLIVHIHIRTMSNWWNYHWRKVIRFCCQKNCIHSIIVIVDVWLVLIMSVFTINNEFELQKSKKKLEYECVTIKLWNENGGSNFIVVYWLKDYKIGFPHDYWALN